MCVVVVVSQGHNEKKTMMVLWKLSLKLHVNRHAYPHKENLTDFGSACQIVDLRVSY